MEADDPDFEVAGDITYSLSGSSCFSIETVSEDNRVLGNITTTKELDRENPNSCPGSLIVSNRVSHFQS